MKKLILAGLVGFGIATANLAFADEELMKANRCVACHNLDGKLVGPNYKSVAEKRAGDPNAQAILVDHIKNGSRGDYGPIPMPPNGHVRDADAEALAKWILSLN